MGLRENTNQWTVSYSLFLRVERIYQEKKSFCLKRTEGGPESGLSTTLLLKGVLLSKATMWGGGPQGETELQPISKITRIVAYVRLIQWQSTGRM